VNDALGARKDFLVEHGFAYNNKIKVIQHMLYGFHGDS